MTLQCWLAGIVVVTYAIAALSATILLIDYTTERWGAKAWAVWGATLILILGAMVGQEVCK